MRPNSNTNVVSFAPQPRKDLHHGNSSFWLLDIIMDQNGRLFLHWFWFFDMLVLDSGLPGQSP